jgi:hypothetical protein
MFPAYSYPWWANTDGKQINFIHRIIPDRRFEGIRAPLPAQIGHTAEVVMRTSRSVTQAEILPELSTITLLWKMHISSGNYYNKPKLNVIIYTFFSSHQLYIAEKYG